MLGSTFSRYSNFPATDLPPSPLPNSPATRLLLLLVGDAAFAGRFDALDVLEQRTAGGF